jgi:hypothetical protein
MSGMSPAAAAFVHSSSQQQRLSAPPMPANVYSTAHAPSGLPYSSRYEQATNMQQPSSSFAFTSGAAVAAAAARRNQFHRRAFSSEKEWAAAAIRAGDYPLSMPDRLHTARSTQFGGSFDSRNNSPSRRALLPSIPYSAHGGGSLQPSMSDQQLLYASSSSNAAAAVAQLPTAFRMSAANYSSQAPSAMHPAIISRSASSSTCSTLVGTTITAQQVPPVSVPGSTAHASRVMSRTGRLMHRPLAFKSHSTERYPGELSSSSSPYLSMQRTFGSPSMLPPSRTRPIVQPNDFSYDDGFEAPLTSGRRLSGNLGMSMYSNAMPPNVTSYAINQPVLSNTNGYGQPPSTGQSNAIGNYSLGMTSYSIQSSGSVQMPLLNSSAPSLLAQQPQMTASTVQSGYGVGGAMMTGQSANQPTNPAGFGFLNKAKNLLSGSVGSLIGNKTPQGACNVIMPTMANGLPNSGDGAVAGGGMMSNNPFGRFAAAGSEPNMNAMAYQANQAAMGGFGANTLLQPNAVVPMMANTWRAVGTAAAMALSGFGAAKRLPVPQTSLGNGRPGRLLRHQLSFSNSEDECDCHEDELHTSGCSSGAEDADMLHIRPLRRRHAGMLRHDTYLDDEDDYEEEEEENSLEGRLAMGSRQSSNARLPTAKCSWHLTEEGTRLIGRLHLNQMLFNQLRRRVQQTRVGLDGLLPVLGVRLGFGSVRGQRAPVIVKLKRNSFAHSALCLTVGDRLLEWNGHSLLNRSQEQIVEIVADSLHEPQIDALIARDANPNSGSGK